MNLSDSLNLPSFLLSPPLNISTDIANNVWMQEMSAIDRKIDIKKALRQWMELYNFISANSLTYLLASQKGLQDQTYVANLGLVLPHLMDDTVVVSNFTSVPRRGESQHGVDLLKNIFTHVSMSPHPFEGEADLKYINNNVYVGGYGIRTSLDALNWFEEKHNMIVIKLKMVEQYLYHLDCMLFPLSVDKILICSEFVDKETIHLLEKHADLIDVPKKHAYNGLTNSLRLKKMILCSSNIDELKVTDDYYTEEREKIDFLQKICAQNGFEPVFFNLSEFTKSGAMLSCCVMHLNYVDYRYSNL